MLSALHYDSNKLMNGVNVYFSFFFLQKEKLTVLMQIKEKMSRCFMKSTKSIVFYDNNSSYVCKG